MATAASGNTISKQHTRLVGVGLHCCFFMSGFAAMLYQIAWLRQFSVVFGSGEIAVAAVLTAHMGGLAGGAGLAARLVARIARPVWTYGLLEAAIAASALAVPALLATAMSIYVWLSGDQASPPTAAALGQPLFLLIVALPVLALPTALMGATLPLLTRFAVRLDRDIGPKVAWLYGLNALGAAAGAVVAGFVLLPGAGLMHTMWSGAAINFAIFGVVAGPLRRALGAESATGAGRATAKHGATAADGFFSACIVPWLAGKPGAASAFHQQPAWILPVMLASGAIAFLHEVLWMRLLTHVVGGSITSLATMLAAFLGGIGLGSLFAARLATDRQRAAGAFVVAQLAIALCSVLLFATLGPLLPATRSLAALAAYAAIVMLPSAVLIGATFPLAVRILAKNVAGAGPAAAKIFAWNTAGAGAGAFLAGFVLLPSLGFEGSIKLAAIANCALALWAAAVIARPRVATLGAAAGGVLLSVFAYHPSRPDAVVSSTGFPLGYAADTAEIFYGVGRSATVLVVQENEVYYLRASGLPEGSVTAKGSPPMQGGEKWLAALPVAARPNAETMLLIGLGGGVALEGAPPSLRSIDVIELEPEVVEANRALADNRDRDPLQDQRVTLIINDARNALRLTSKRYDAIVSQLSHPWTSASSHLFTRDFLIEAKTHLTENGVFVQWIDSEFVDAAALRSMAATLASAFGNVRLYHPSSQMLAFLASDGEIEPEMQIAGTGEPITDDVMHYSRMGMNGVEDLIAALVVDEDSMESFADGATVSTDDNLLLATRSRSRADGLTRSELGELFRIHDPLRRRDSWIFSRLANRIDYGYVARKLILLGQQARVAQLAEAHPDASTRSLIVGLLYAARGDTTQANAAYLSALERNPANAQARYYSIARNLAQLAQGSAEGTVVERAQGLPVSAAAVIQGWQFAQQQDWQSLAQIDGVLGRAGVTDAWYPDATRLRVEWRSKVTSDLESYAFDALRLIDRAILIEPDRNSYLLRAAIGIALQDGGVTTESSRQVVRLVRESLQQAHASGALVSQRELLVMKQNLAAIVTSLRGDLVAAGRRRAEAVSRDANALIRYIDSVLPPPEE
jgi:spermidine synthase